MKNPKKKFAQIYDKNLAKIYRFVFLKVGSQEVAEDLTSQVFTKGWGKFRKGEDIRNVPAYLYQIARSEISHHFRDKDKFKIISTEATDIVDPQPAIEEQHQTQSEIERLRKCLANLDNDCQDVVIWRYLDGYSNKEIAAMMDKEETAVRVMLHRALKELKGEMENL